MITRYASTLAATVLMTAAAHAQTVAPGDGPTLTPPGQHQPGAAPAPQPAAVPAATARDTVRRWFDGFELVPTEQHYRALGDALGPALIGIAADATEHPVVRARAVSAMVYADDPATLDHVTRLLDDPDGASLIRRKAALVLAERTGPAAIDRLAQTLTNAGDDLALREACARGLRIVGPAAITTRDALLRTETAPTVRGLLLPDKRIGLE